MIEIGFHVISEVYERLEGARNCDPYGHPGHVFELMQRIL